MRFFLVIFGVANFLRMQRDFCTVHVHGVMCEAWLFFEVVHVVQLVGAC